MVKPISGTVRVVVDNDDGGYTIKLTNGQTVDVGYNDRVTVSTMGPNKGLTDMGNPAELKGAARLDKALAALDRKLRLNGVN